MHTIHETYSSTIVTFRGINSAAAFRIPWWLETCTIYLHRQNVHSQLSFYLVLEERRNTFSLAGRELELGEERLLYDLLIINFILCNWWCARIFSGACFTVVFAFIFFVSIFYSFEIWDRNAFSQFFIVIQVYKYVPMLFVKYPVL